MNNQQLFTKIRYKLRRFYWKLKSFLLGITDLFQSLEIKLKLSMIIALIVIVVITVFSVPVLIRQKNILIRQVSETGRVVAEQMSQNVKDILLCKVTNQECDPDRTVQEELEKLMRTRVSGLEYAFTIDRNGDLIIKPDTLRAVLQIDAAKLQKLLALNKPARGENKAFIEYFQPVQVLKEGENRRITIGVVGVGFSKRAIQGPVNETRNLILTTAGLIIIISVWGIYFLAERMVNQITALVNAAREVGMGNLDVEVNLQSKDELGQLAREFNNMVMHLREKLQMQKFVSKLTVQMIKERGGSRLRPAEGERHQVTILFSDVRNFTTIAERLEPEQIVRLINIYFHLQTEIIERYGGVVDKFMGDQIMAIFPSKNMLENAVAAAIQIQRSIRDLNQRRQAAGEVILEVGIGINHGDAVLGNMGSRHRMDYTVIGDVVNIAARLCSIAKAGQIIASLGALESLNGKYPTNRLQPIIVKGRSRPIEICEIDYDREVIM